MRLIDADTLVKDLSYLYTKNHIPVDMRTKEILTTIMEQPTAYDIDKVVEELEKNASRYTKKYVTPYGNNGYKDTKAISIRKAIEIVKKGGVSDDVGELRLLNGHKFLHETSCGYVFDMQNDFKYCPYCGKKIKAVE